MAREFKLSLLLSARDEASKSITRSLRETVKETQKAEQAQEKLHRRQKTTAQDAISQGRARTEDMKRQSRAYETLGIRSERAIQREISQTIAAYNRLARSGMMSADEQARAFDRMRQRVSQLRGEMQQMSRIKIGNIGSNIATAAGGLYAGAQAFSEPVKKRMSYEEQILRMANTAFNDKKDPAERIESAKGLDATIRSAVTKFGGTKEDAAQAMNDLLASGEFNGDTVADLIPLIQKYSVAGGVSGSELANVLVALKRNSHITDPEKLKKAFDMSMKAGQLGSVEFPDMAKWMPELLSAADSLGMDSLDGLSIVLSALEASRATAGSNDQAANNLKNLLLKLNSTDAANRAASIQIDGYGIDLTGTLKEARKKGINPVDAMLGLTDRIAEKNPEYQALKKKLDSGEIDDAERQRTMVSMAKILEGSAMGELIGDQQALMALIALRSQREYMSNIRKELEKQRDAAPGQGEGDLSYAVMASGDGFKAQRASEAASFAEMDSVERLSNTVGSLSDQFTKFSTEFPTFTTALMGAKTSIEAMTQAALAFAALKFLFGGSGAGSAGSIAGTVGTSGATAASGGWLKPAAFKLAGFATAATEFATANTPEETDELINGEARMAALRARYGDDVIAKAKERFQPWYQVGSGYAAENEEWVNRYIQEQDEQAQLANTVLSQVRFLSERTGMKTDALPKEFVPDYAKPVSDDVIAGLMLPVREIETLLKNQQSAPQPIELRSVVELDGHVIAETVNTINGNDAGRTTGGGL
ncbi:phage tail tape measure protein [Morganella morganii]|uniref:phage tail tape measure protein n=1 Tax=Morganella morganii TaxID=582 RepID=UPI00339C912B